jgi:hypothetical protein
VSILGSASRVGTEREQRHGVSGSGFGRTDDIKAREGNGMIHNPID